MVPDFSINNSDSGQPGPMGYTHVYTGNGKGKTTAALGLALRAAGSGMKVFIAQFVKGMHYGELDSIQHIPNITLKQYGRDCFIHQAPEPEDVEAARAGLQEVSERIKNHDDDLVILDEVCIALYFHLFETVEVIELIRSKPRAMELVLTGRYAPVEIIEIADLVTEMKEVRHYFSKGIMARKGIDY